MLFEFRTVSSSSHGSFRLATIAIIFACPALVNTASAQFIEGVSVADFSTELGGGFQRLAVESIDGSGFDEATLTHNSDPAVMWLNNGVFAQPNDPLPVVPGVDPNPFIVYDLGGVYDLSSIHVWNYNEVMPPDGRDLAARGGKDVRISTGLTVNSVTPLDNGNNGDFVWAKATGLDGYEGEVIDVSGFAVADVARVLRIDFFTNHDGDNDFIGISEIRFAGDERDVTGDVDLDGNVDLADFQPISDNIFQNVNTREEGDLTGDGVVDFFDYREWKDKIDSINPALAAGISFESLGAVPEPNSALLALISALAMGLLTRCRRALPTTAA